MATPPASKPTKCGEKSTSRASLRKAEMSPVTRKRLSNCAREPCHSQLLSSQACATRTNTERSNALRSAADMSGKHSERFTRTTLRRGQIARYKHCPSSQPMPRTSGSGSGAKRRMKSTPAWLNKRAKACISFPFGPCSSHHPDAAVCSAHSPINTAAGTRAPSAPSPR